MDGIVDLVVAAVRHELSVVGQSNAGHYLDQKPPGFWDQGVRPCSTALQMILVVHSGVSTSMNEQHITVLKPPVF